LDASSELEKPRWMTSWYEWRGKSPFVSCRSNV